MENAKRPMTVIQYGELYFCLEQRVVSVQGQEIKLTAKEFDIENFAIPYDFFENFQPF